MLIIKTILYIYIFQSNIVHDGPGKVDGGIHDIVGGLLGRIFPTVMRFHAQTGPTNKP